MESEPPACWVSVLPGSHRMFFPVLVALLRTVLRELLEFYKEPPVLCVLDVVCMSD